MRGSAPQPSEYSANLSALALIGSIRLVGPRHSSLSLRTTTVNSCFTDAPGFARTLSVSELVPSTRSDGNCLKRREGFRLSRW